MPDETSRLHDAHETIVNSPMRQAVYFGQCDLPTHQSTERESQKHFDWGRRYGTNVVTSPIAFELDGFVYRWDYSHPPGPGKGPVQEFYRVFIVRDQGLDLDIESSLDAMGLSEGHAVTPSVRALLSTEVAKVDNLVILQIMYDRLQSGQSMLPDKTYTPVKITQKPE